MQYFVMAMCIIGLVTTAMAHNWLAFIWCFTALAQTVHLKRRGA